MSSFVRWIACCLALIFLLSTAVSADMIYSTQSGAVPGESSSAKASASLDSSWVDDCDDTASPYVVYQNLQPSDHLGTLTDFPALPDTTGLTLTHPEYPGRAIYSVRGRSSVTLTFFSHNGTFATKGANGWVRGGQGDTIKDPQRLYYDRQSGRIFLPDGEGDLTYCHMVKSADYGFCSLEGSLSRDEWYGVNLSYSLDGTRFLPIAPTAYQITCYDSSSPIGLRLYQEEYNLTLPSGTAYLQVELREVPSIPSVEKKNGQWTVTGTDPSVPSSYLIFTSAQLHGGSDSPPLPSPLPEEEEEEETDKKGSSSSSRSSSGSSTTTNNTTTSTETVDNHSTSQTTTTNNNTTTVINNYYFFTPEALSYLEKIDPSLLTLGDSGLAYVIGNSAGDSPASPASSDSASPSLPPETLLLLAGGCILFLFAVLFKQSK